mmetsp:Transcript_21955/g.32422  ORF Transcript_21955/g.32422 Transcript_21955/m.32422 type:complete len:102 (+) Transcript_21955:10-315(+)
MATTARAATLWEEQKLSEETQKKRLLQNGDDGEGGDNIGGDGDDGDGGDNIGGDGDDGNGGDGCGGYNIKNLASLSGAEEVRLVVSLIACTSLTAFLMIIL